MESVFNRKHQIRYYEEIPAGKEHAIDSTILAFQRALKENPGWAGYNMSVDADERIDGTIKLKIVLVSPEHDVRPSRFHISKIITVLAWIYIGVYGVVVLIPWEKL